MELVWRADESGTWANVSFSADQLGVHQYRHVSGHVFQNDSRRPIHPGAHDAKPRAIDIDIDQVLAYVPGEGHREAEVGRLPLQCGKSPLAIASDANTLEVPALQFSH